MPKIICHECADAWLHDSEISESIDACPHCKTKHKVTRKEAFNWKVEANFPSLKDLSEVWSELNDIEKEDLEQISKSIGIGAPKPGEMACIGFLENFLKRIYKEKGTMGDLLPLLEKDNDLKDIAGVISYFREHYNKLKHVPGYRSTESKAISTFNMTKELVKTTIYKKIIKSRREAV